MIDDRVHYYAFPKRPKVESFEPVITGIISICHRPSLILFFPGSTLSYVSTYFTSRLDLMCKSITISICVSNLIGDSLVVN